MAPPVFRHVKMDGVTDLIWRCFLGICNSLSVLMCIFPLILVLITQIHLNSANNVAIPTVRLSGVHISTLMPTETHTAKSSPNIVISIKASPTSGIAAIAPSGVCLICFQLFI